MSKPETMNAQASAEAERLRNAIEDMNATAQDGFRAVAAIARLAAHQALDQSEPGSSRVLQTAMLTLALLAEDYANTVDVTAETAIGQDSAT